MTTRPPAVRLMQNLGLQPDPWQVEVLETAHKRLLLNCCRQAGKSTVVAVLALSEAVFVPFSKILLLSRSHRQSMELFRIVTDYFVRLGTPLRSRLNAQELVLTNHSRIVCLPCREETVRGYSDVSLLIIDEAARVPDDLYRSVRPMLATSDGRLICLSTPYGKRGFFHDCWAKGGTDWLRIEIPADKVPRITPTFLAQERRCLGESWYRQEYTCSFESLEGLVYPDFARCVVPALPAHFGRADIREVGRRVGGIDFGFRNPFAAVWGIIDRDDILWLQGEHYAREKPLSYHAQFLPPNVHWYADPAGAGEISELRRADFTVGRGKNDRRLGIAAVRARMEDGTLRVLEGRCPNLLSEAGLYRYGSPGETDSSETPLDEHNHALAALRYLIATIDVHRTARLMGQESRVRSQGAGIRDQGSGVRDQGSGIRDQVSGVRDQGSGIGDQESAMSGDGQSPLSPLRGEGPGVRGWPLNDNKPTPRKPSWIDLIRDDPNAPPYTPVVRFILTPDPRPLTPDP